MTTREERLAELRPYAERARRVTGWSFGVNTVSLGPPPPWSYDDRAAELLRGAALVLTQGNFVIEAVK